MDWIVFQLYRFALLPFIYALARALVVLPLKNKFFDSLHFRLKKEFHYNSTFDPKKKSIGIHAASGEIEYAFPLIRKIKVDHPEYNIVVTLSSTSVLKSVINCAEVDAVGPSPIDLFWQVNRFLTLFNFKLFLFARTDVWPELSWQLQQAKIPSFLFSATFSEKSARKSNILNALTRWSLNLLTKIFTVSDKDLSNLKSIRVHTSILSLGDTRYDQVFHKKNISAKKLPLNSSQKNIFVAGSTWPEDDAILLPVIARTSSQWSFVVAPHEVDESSLKKMELFFSSHNLKTLRLSQLLKDTQKISTTTASGDQWDVLLVDLYGYLFYLYEWAALAFVGGSFKEKVHSVMEPLSFFKPVCVGPKHTNNREALEFGQIKMSQFPISWVQTISNSNDLESLLKIFSQIDNTNFTQLQSELNSLISNRQGTTQKIYEEIKNHL